MPLNTDISEDMQKSISADAKNTPRYTDNKMASLTQNTFLGVKCPFEGEMAIQVISGITNEFEARSEACSSDLDG